ncbi:uncharacterized protein LOC132737861 [Ruditapes philippinarum]|uniref:uncharacterized protein LOC132737861 n=1 Tax=Ruditapes philippinarum TaxID=129788 RepID=UPI00295AEE2B|nr:uncharacterized protein LOC132737861 [Ruditapes philippinarum]
MKRYKRVQEREKNRIKHQVARTLIELSSTNEPEFVATPLTADVLDQDPEPICQLTFDELNNDDDTCVDELVQVTQSQVNSELQRLLNENYALKQELQQVELNESSFENNDEKVKYYTGLPNSIMLMTVFDFVKDYIPKQRVNSELSQFERLIMTLMRLKLNFPVQYLAYQFNTSTSTVSRTFTTMIHILFVRFKHLLYWPKREELRQTMPLEFRKSFGQKTAVIIDCFEVFIQRPKNLLARAQTWSSYKHTNTVKFLVGITPQGSISFLSKAWGGRASDKYITENCGILGKLLPGDLVLADRGFDIADSVGMCCAQVNIPAFTKGKAQLSAIDVETTRKIAHVRIHVERVIGLVRNKYTILQDRLPVDFLICEEGLPVVDKIATVACALTNMSDSVVPLN